VFKAQQPTTNRDLELRKNTTFYDVRVKKISDCRYFVEVIDVTSLWESVNEKAAILKSDKDYVISEFTCLA
jgi:hypothetical protein